MDLYFDIIYALCQWVTCWHLLQHMAKEGLSAKKKVLSKPIGKEGILFMSNETRSQQEPAWR